MQKLKGLFAQSNLISKLLILMGVVLFFTSLALSLGIAFTGGNTTDTSAMKILQLLQSVGMFVLPPFVLAYLLSKKPTDYLQINKIPPVTDLLIVLGLMVLAIPFINLLVDWNGRMILPAGLAEVEKWMRNSEEQTRMLTEKLLESHGWPGLAFNLFLVAVIPALGEELFFRGLIQRTLANHTSAKAALWISAIVFSAIHMQFYGFIPRMLLGAFFGYLLLWSGNLWLPILAHFINNAVTVIFYHLKTNGYQVIDIDSIGTGSNWWIGCLSAILTALGIYLFHKHMRHKSIGN